MAIAEQIRFLVSVDAAGASAAFGELGSSLDKASVHSKEAQANAKSLIGFGAKALVVAGAMGLGLGAAAQATSNLTESLNFANHMFEDSIGIVDDWAKHAARSAGLSEAQALQAAAGFAALGKAAGISGDDLANFSVKMGQLAADLASLRNTSLEDATAAITSALRGRYVAISKYGVVINDAILKQEAFNEGTYDGTGKLSAQARILATYNLLLSQTTAAHGDFVRTSGNFANQQRILAANFENLKAGIGQGVLPVLNTLTGALNTGVEWFNGLGDSTKSAVGGMATWATVAIGTVGAISVVSGALIKLKSNLTNVGGGLNLAGKAAVGFGTAIAALGAAQTAFDVINQINNVAGKASDALKALAIASKGSSTDMLKAFSDLAKSEDDTLRFSHLWEDFGKSIKVVGTSASHSIEDLDRAFNKLMEQSPKQAQDFLNAMRSQADALDHNSQQYKDNEMLIDRWQKKLNLTTGSQSVMASETADATQELQAEGEATKLVSDQFDKAVKSLDDLSMSQAEAQAASKGFADAMDSFKLDDVTQSTLDVRDALDQFLTDAKAAPPVVDQMQLLTGKLSEEQDKSTKSLLDLGQQYQSYLKGLVDAGVSTDQVRGQTTLLINEFKKHGKQIGLTDAQMQAYLTTIGLTPAQVETDIKLSGDAEAKERIKLYQGLLDDIPDDVKTAVAAYIAEGDYQAAAAALDNLAKDRTANVFVKVIPTKSVPGASQGGVGGGVFSAPAPPTTNVTINVPPTLNPQKVTDAVRTQQTRTGALSRG